MGKTARPAAGVFFVPQLEGKGCASRVYKSLRTMDGVSNVELNFVSDTAYVSFDAGKVSANSIKKAILSAAPGEGGPGPTSFDEVGGSLRGSGTAINPARSPRQRKRSRG